MNENNNNDQNLVDNSNLSVDSSDSSDSVKIEVTQSVVETPIEPKVTQSVVGNVGSEQVISQPSVKKGNGGLFIVVGSIVVVIIGAILFFVFYNNNLGGRPERDKKSTSFKDKLREEIEDIVNDNVSINDEYEDDFYNDSEDDEVMDDAANGDSGEDLNDNEVSISNDDSFDYDNYNVSIEMNVTTNGISVNQVSKGTIDEVNQVEYLETTATTMGFPVTYKTYTDIKNGITYMSTPYGGEWTKDKGASQLVDIGLIHENLKNNKNITKIDNNHYKMIMNKKDASSVAGMNNGTSLNSDVSVDIFLENGRVKKLYYDFSKVVSGIDKFDTTITFSDYNTAGNLSIPKDVISAAK